MTQTSDHTVAIFDSIMRASKSFVYRSDNADEVNMLYMSGCVQEMTGCREEQLLNSRDLSYGSLCHPDDLQPMIDAVDAAIAVRQSWDLNYRLVRPDGSTLLVRERGNAVFEEGEVAYLQALVSDATAEDMLRREIEQNAKQAQNANQDILNLANKIVHSVQALKMLSINSRIEAARAGEAGLGFAVVASEISKLAATNADCANEIAARMSGQAKDSRVRALT